MERLLLVALGGGVGAALRFGVAELFLRTGKGGVWDWPLATLTVNVVGCFLIGVLAPLVSDGRLSAEMRLLLLVGVLGGFTTFSAFGLEVMDRVRGGELGAALLIVLLNNVLGIGAVWAGWMLTGRGETV